MRSPRRHLNNLLLVTIFSAVFVNVTNAGELEDEVRLFGNTAVITGLSDMKLIWGGKQYEFTIRFLEVSRKVDANWQRGSPFGSMPTDRFRCKQSLAYRQVTPAGNPSAEGFFTNAEVMLNPSSTESAGEKPHSGTATPSGRLKHQRSW